MDRLKDKVCVITGADGGICHKASEFFCAEGAKVVMVDIDPAVEAKCAEIVANGGDAIAITADVSKRETCRVLRLQGRLQRPARRGVGARPRRQPQQPALLHRGHV